MRQFCTAGPVQADIHYHIPPLERIDRDQILGLIEGRKYFILHAPRQTGKTSALLALVDELNASGRYRALYTNVEGAQANRDDMTGAMRAIVSVLSDQAKRHLNDPFPSENRARILEQGGGTDALRLMLAEWAAHSPLPICLMIDEIDAMVGDSLISVLRQLRSGYLERPKGFPQSIILCGVRDVRDYRIHGSKEVITGGSAFNIKAESLRLGNFTPEHVRRLYLQHTQETGQRFEEEVFPLVWDLTRGQPWLVNALAYEACFKIETKAPITAAIIHVAKERLILSRQTHIDQLADKLQEERVRRVIQPILLGEQQLAVSGYDDDTQYAIDLGLIEHTADGGLAVANAIYREVIPRELTFQTQIAMNVSKDEPWYVEPGGSLDMAKLLAAFQQFFRENAESWLERFTYREAGPQLLLQAFLQRLVNGGGRIDREYALGRRRTDLLVVWKDAQRSVIEIKIQRKSLNATVEEGLKQTAGYMDRVGARDGHLVIFNRDANVPWEERIFRRQEQAGNHRITVWGM